MIDDIYEAFGINQAPRRTITIECPVHGGVSLTITDSGDKAVIACGAGCETEDVLDAVGLTWSDLFES
jgi:putative DNA primase/helicase